MLCLMTLADVEAVSRETLTPWKEELLWRLYVDTYNYLTLSYGDEVHRPQAGGARRGHRRAAGRPHGRERSRRSSQGLPRRYLQLFSREAVYQHVRLSRDLGPRLAPGLARAEGRGLGADRPHTGPAVPLLEHLRRALLVRHGHPARLRLHQARRPRRRHVPLQRRRAVSRAEPGRRSADHPAARGRRRGPHRRRRPAQGPRGGRASAGGCRASRRSSTATTTPRGATPSSRSWRRTRSACCTA